MPCMLCQFFLTVLKVVLYIDIFQGIASQLEIPAS